MNQVERREWIRFDRHEVAGAFGDIGTDLPLIVGLIAFCGFDAASVCIVFGLLQVATGFLYGIPMPVQPLKAMAVIMLAQRLSPGTMAGGGLVIGITMLLLAATHSLDWIARVIPLAVVRGIQLGLGLMLARSAAHLIHHDREGRPFSMFPTVFPKGDRVTMQVKIGDYRSTLD